MSVRRRITATAALLAAASLVAAPVLGQANTTTTARYTMDAGTTSGMAAMGSGGGGLGGMLNMMRGGGGQAGHELVLRLGSIREAADPDADHFMPRGARLGTSVPLVTPRRTASGPAEPGVPGQMQMPSGRLLLFWGCGEHAGRGQPVVIDFARMARGEVPAGLFAPAVDIPEAWNITTGNSRTYGDWPNERNSESVRGDASLLGAHRIASNYAPEISFTLDQDFMPALNLSQGEQASGAVALSWNGLAAATGYYAWAFAGQPGADGQVRDMVWWSSSRTQAFGGPMADWVSPAAARRLVEAGTVLPPTQTSCTIPAEVKQAGGSMMMTWLYGYGPEANFAYPPRPANSRAPYVPEWIARVRFRSSTMAMVGMPGLGGTGSGGAAEAGEGTEAPPAGDTRPRCRGGLRGMAERAAGLCQ